MVPSRNPRARTISLLLGLVVVCFAVLGGLQAFDTTRVHFLNPETASETLILTALTALFFLLLLLGLVLLLRNVLKAYVSQSDSALSARLRSRLATGAMLIATTPAVFMFLFCFTLLNRSMDRWFSPNTSELREDSARVVLELAEYVTSNARVEAESVTASGATDKDAASLRAELEEHRVTLAGGFVVVYDGKDSRMLDSFLAPPESSVATLHPGLDEGGLGPGTALHGPLSVNLLAAAQRRDQPVMQISGQEYALGISKSAGNKIVVVALPMPQGLSQTAARIHSGSVAYWELFRKRNQIRTVLVLVLLLITAVVFFTSIWLARFLSLQITRPVEALAEAMDEIAAGKYEHRVTQITSGEMGELVRSFNHMAADLEASRQLALTSSAQLTTVNQALEERRRELETIVETIPSGVVTLDGAGQVLQSNRAFAALLGLDEEASLKKEKIDALLPADCADDVSAMIRRARRMGAASMELDLHAHGRTAHLAITCARLELVRGRPGTVMVMEDTTELMRAQRQMAWKEVAQRVAHEIKNPLTPIALSAERIARHLDRQQTDSPAVIRKCSEVILSCVATLRTLVDQFSALAQFPAPQPRACEINDVVNAALALFQDRLEGITIERTLAADLPTVLADSDALRRALANLIDNAAEAMQGSLLHVLSLRTHLAEEGEALEVEVADTGHGITEEIRERLFLPFYSTKHRGTGLGLSIAAKIAQEHGGSLRAEPNTPKGARFVLRLPLMMPALPEPPAHDAATREMSA